MDGKKAEGEDPVVRLLMAAFLSGKPNPSDSEVEEITTVFEMNAARKVRLLRLRQRRMTGAAVESTRAELIEAEAEAARWAECVRLPVERRRLILENERLKRLHKQRSKEAYLDGLAAENARLAAELLQEPGASAESPIERVEWVNFKPIPGVTYSQYDTVKRYVCLAEDNPAFRLGILKGIGSLSQDFDTKELITFAMSKGWMLTPAGFDWARDNGLLDAGRTSAPVDAGQADNTHSEAKAKTPAPVPNRKSNRGRIQLTPQPLKWADVTIFPHSQRADGVCVRVAGGKRQGIFVTAAELGFTNMNGKENALWEVFSKAIGTELEGCDSVPRACIAYAPPTKPVTTRKHVSEIRKILKAYFRLLTDPFPSTVGKGNQYEGRWFSAFKVER